jgi:CYTH domain-containing protein
MINLEIERKFLLEKVPEFEYDDIIKITQHYLKLESSWERYRKAVHRNGDIKYYKTLKTHISFGTVEEEEVELSESNYNKLIELCKSGKFECKVLKKKRHVHYLSKDLKWEIDKMKGKDIVIAEIELPSIDSEFKTPKWIKKQIIKEVTDDESYSSKCIAKDYDNRRP